MKCPKCRSENNRVYDSRETECGNMMRRRVCYNCGNRFKTFEVVLTPGQKEKLEKRVKE